jgi:sec-independent protein translocase protein TatA
MFGLSGPWEIALIVLVVVLLFGTKKLPELGSGMGKAISNFRKSYKESSAIDITPKDDEEETPADGK